MPDREKVIKGLECCITLNGGLMEPNCEDCPYIDDERTCLTLIPLLEDALELLKEQEPRVMTFEEADALAHRTIETGVYLERREDLNIYAAIAGNTQGIVPNLSWMGKKRNFLDEYGEMWRCWTARPTDKQRGETPWEK